MSQILNHITSLLTYSWSITFLRQSLKYLSISSSFRLRRAVLDNSHNMPSAEQGIVRIRMCRPQPTTLSLRKRGSDCETFCEVFLTGIYNGVVGAQEHCEYIIDLGANIGFSTIFFAIQCPAARIIAIEPNPANFALLRENTLQLAANGRVQLLEAALWRSDEPVVLEAPHANRFDAFQVREAPATNGGTVAGKTIDTIIKQSGFPRIDLLKVDIEGSETELFSGDLTWLARTRKIAIEFHGDSRRRSGFDEVLAGKGFRIDDSDKHTVVATNCSTAAALAN